MSTRHHDLVIIGTGSGNSVVTPQLAHLDIAVVESGRFGGTCLNVGCIPTKMYVYPADLIVEARRAVSLGVRFAKPQVSWDAIRDRVFGRIDPIAAGGESYRRSQERVTVYGGHARFVGERRLSVDLADGPRVTIEGERVVIAAGGHAVGLDLDGLRGADPERGVHTSDTVMRMGSLPGRMAVIGGGFIAAELAHVLDAFGVAVTHVHRRSRLLKAEDEEVAQRFTEIAGRRYDLHLESRIVAAQRRDDGVWALTVAGPSRAWGLEVDAVLLAVGRRPNADALDVAAGGVAQHRDGRVVVDGFQRTSAAGVYALGDVSSDYELKHVANHEARVVAHNLAVDVGAMAGPLRASDHRFVPHAVFGHPQIASFGPTRAQLEASGTPYLAKTQAYGDVAYGWAMEDSQGFLTVYADPQTRRLLAAHCMGFQASTVIQPLIQAASFGQPADEVARGQYWIHPALAEVVENALLGLDFPS